MINKIIGWFVGKKIATETGELTVASRTKLIAIIGAILPAIEPVSTAFGHPIHVPDFVYKVLAGAGLWTLRDSIPAK